MKILAMPDGNWLSHTSRTLEVAKKLREHGHDVIFAGDGKYMKLALESGFRAIRVDTIDPERAIGISRSGRTHWYDYELMKSLVAAELEVFRAESPDLVLCDFRMSLSTSCEMAGIPLAAILNAAWTNYYTAKLRAPEHLPLTRILGRPITTLLLPVVKGAILSLDSRPINRFRRDSGLAPRGNIWDAWRGDLNLIVDIPEYGPTRNLPDSFHYIGPIVWEPDIEVPAWLDTLDPDRPTLYFTMGSTGFARFFQQAVEIFGDSDYQCVMTTAGMVDLGKVPDNVFVVDYAPGSAIMEKSDLVICQGGNGTIYQAMSRGVPIIGIPTMHDQEFNLDRVTDLGIGIHLSERKLRPEHLVAAVGEVLCQGSYRANARKYEQILARYDGPATGAKLISDFLAAN